LTSGPFMTERSRVRGLHTLSLHAALPILACWPGARAAVARVVGALRSGRLRWWEVLGGTAGGFYVAAQGLTAATLGVALFMVAVDRKSTRLNSSHVKSSYAVFCLTKTINS